ncbi:MAG: hypothetical protein AAGF11_29730 [Myxococcota bacterium]
MSCSCGDRVLGDDPESYGEPACLWLISPRGLFADGSSAYVHNEIHGGTATACLCLTEDEYDSLGERLSRRGWPPPGTLLEEYNELAYAECKRLSALREFVDDECLEYYETGEWLKDIYWSEPPFENATPPGFTCLE